MRLLTFYRGRGEGGVWEGLLSHEAHLLQRRLKTVLLWGLLLGACLAAPAQAKGFIAFTGGTVIDGTGAPPLPGGTVLIEGERITAVGPGSEITLPEAAQVIDARGKWIIPGLIDAHIHFFQSGGLYTRPDIIDLRAERPYSRELDWLRARLPQTLARYLASGVTSVVDMGGPLWTFEVRQLAQERLLAPRVAVAGPLLSRYRPEVFRLDDPPLIKIQSPEQARAAVRRILHYQPDLIKLWLIRLPDQPLMAKEAWVRAAIEESHAHGKRVAVHATQREMARAAVEAGADILVHSIDDRAVDPALVARLKARRILYIPTFMVQEGYREVLGQDLALSPIERRIGDPQVIATFNDLAALQPWRGRLGALSSFSIRPLMGHNLKHLQEKGITIAAGTDAGNIGTLHGPALHRELELMAQASLSALDILVAATRGGAQVMGRESELGTLEAGKLADLLILEANPLEDIRHTRRIYRVVKGGTILDPEQILKNLENLSSG